MGRSVLVIDDHPGFRSEARQLLSADGFSVIGEAADCATALSETTRLRPDIVVLDIGLPDGSGLDLVPRLREASPATQIVLVSARREADYGGRIIAARVEGFVEKASLRAGTLEAALAGTHSSVNMQA